jgi:hypothetical protein
MKYINFSPIDNNIFLTTINQDIEIYREDQRIFSGFLQGQPVVTASFSHDGRHVIFINEGETKLNIISFNDLLKKRENYVFHFISDFSILDYVVSTNQNQVAVLFKVSQSFNDTINGTRTISEDNRDKYLLHVYDFTPGNCRLIFQKYEDDLHQMALSEDNKLAIKGTFVVNGENCEVIIFNLDTAAVISYGYEHDTVYSICFFPRNSLTPQTDNKILIIKMKDDSNFRKIEIRNTNTFELIDARETNVDIINYVSVSRNSAITLGTEYGFFFFLLTVDYPVSVFLPNIKLHELSYSLEQDKIGISCYNYNIERGIHISNVIVYKFWPENRIIFNSNPLLQDITLNAPYRPIIRNVRDDADVLGVIDPVIHNEPNEPEIQDLQLDIVVPTQPTNVSKLRKYGKNQCYDVIQMSDENIGSYLSNDTDNIVIFYKNPSDADFLATCSTFSALKKYLKDPNHVFYKCVDRKDFRTYHTDPPEFLKLPTQSHTIFVSYLDIKQKYMQRQNMIFLEHSHIIKKTITSMASMTMNFVGRNHCQKGSIIDVYRIIF